MFKAPLNYMQGVRDRQRVLIALTKGAAMMQARDIDPSVPATWEFSGFSQNGEDGVIDVLRRGLSSRNRYFVEIGSSDGVENNTAWLLVAENYNGLMVEGDPELVEQAHRAVTRYSIGAECLQMFVTRDNVSELAAAARDTDPDVFSLDIDGNDYWIAEALFEAGFRPRIFVVEFNSVFGPERSVTTPYREDFVFTEAHPTALYYGVSIAAWRKFFDRHGYRFVTVEQNGVNAFFVDPAHFDTDFLDGVTGLGFAENQYQYRKHKLSTEDQFALIADQELVSI